MFEKEMSGGGFVKLLGFQKWRSIKKSVEIRKYNSLDEYHAAGFQNSRIISYIDCKCKDNCFVNKTFTCLKAVFPIYYIFGHKNVEYFVDPSENEKLERILEGTDNPMYEFVHELRYNPNSFMKGRELQEAKEDFEKKRKIE